jgi:uncharacterized membrane protein
MFHFKVDRLFGKSSFGKRTRRMPVRNPLTRRLGVEHLEDRMLLSAILGSAENFAVLGHTTVTNTGPSVIFGSATTLANAGVYAAGGANAITGFAPSPANTFVGPGSHTNGPGLVNAPAAIHLGDLVANQARNDLITAYTALASYGTAINESGQVLGNGVGGTLPVLSPGVYSFSSTAQLNGTLKLDAGGHDGAFWVFQIGTDLTTASASAVQLINPGGNLGSDVGVYWVLGTSNTAGLGSATLGTTTAFEGNILALTSITLNTGATIYNGRALARNGAVTLDTNTISDICPPASSSPNSGPGFSRGLEIINGIVVPVAPTSSIIIGMKFNDLNGDGTKQAGDPGLSGFTVFLDANNNGVLDAGETFTTTDANGNYSFVNLAPGTYRVREVQQTGFTQTTLNPAAITLTSVQIVSGVNFGNFRLISISGNKFQDTNGNGVRNPGEGGLQGFTIFLDANNNGVLDTGERSTTTDANGNYSFANIGPGTYRVREVVKLGFVQMTNNPANIVATSGTNVTGILFGNIPAANLAAVSKLLFTGRNLTNLLNGTFANQANFVANLYQTLLSRAPDLAGLTYYLRLLQAGYSQQQVTAIFRANFRL